MRTSMNQPFKRFSQLPFVLVDVGASGGIQKKWNQLQPYLRVIGFEPDERSSAELQEMNSSDTSHVFFSVGLSDVKGKATLYLAKTKTDSSFFPSNQPFLKEFPLADRFDSIGTTDILVDTLDNQLREHAIGDADFIKVDTQGSELMILRGSEKILKTSVFGVEVEVEFSELYRGQPLFADVDQFLRSLGFQLFDLAPCFWKRKVGKNLGGKRGQIMYANALYFKKPDIFFSSLEHLPNSPSRVSKVFRSVCACVLHGYHDYALQILTTAKTIFSKDEYDGFFAYVSDLGAPRSSVPDFPGRAMLAQLFRRMAEKLSSPYFRWNQFRDEVGNGEDQ